MNAPRCGKPMTRYEPQGWPPVLEDPVCGRIWNHGGPCRSEMSLARMRRHGVTQRAAGSPALAAIIRETRALAGWSQRDLARALGVSQRTVLGWEKAERRPDEAALARVAEILAQASRHRSELEDGLRRDRRAAA
jgi:DNA-binding transcriptional regulator YiaG